MWIPTVSLACLFVGSFVCLIVCLCGCLFCPVLCLFVRSFVHASVRSFAGSLARLFIRSFWKKVKADDRGCWPHDHQAIPRTTRTIPRTTRTILRTSGWLCISGQPGSTLRRSTKDPYQLKPNYEGRKKQKADEAANKCREGFNNAVGSPWVLCLPAS